MKFITTISIIAALGLSACDSTPGDSSKTKTEEKVMEDKATDSTAANTTTSTANTTAESTAVESDQAEEPVVDAAAEEVKITDTYWKLVTLEGKDIEDAENPHDQPHFMLNSKDQQVTGNGGCNGFFGSYTLAEGNRIKFDKIGSTKRMCADTVVNENEFMQVLGQTDSYRIQDDMLELYIGHRAPLAVFEAITNEDP